MFCSFLLFTFGKQSSDYQLIENTLYRFEVPVDFICHFSGPKKNIPHKRKIQVKDNKVLWELYTLSWGNQFAAEGTFDELFCVDIRSFRKVDGNQIFLDDVVDKVPEARWPEGMKMLKTDEGCKKGEKWLKAHFKGEIKGLSVDTGETTDVVWKYILFLEKLGTVHYIVINITDKLRSSNVNKYEAMVDRIINSFKAK